MRYVVTLAAITVAILAAALEADGAKNASFYWTSNTADLAITDSIWAAKRGIDVASCKGYGPRRKQYGLWQFKSFRCALRNGQFERAGWVSLRTTGPETHRLFAFQGVPRPCS